MLDCNKKRYDFEDLLDIMRILRAPGGCPWDGEQTHESIRRNFIEEVYEACEAIDISDDRLLCEELGDVLLQVVFHAQIACDRGAFNIEDVCDGVSKKLIHRHPHIFGDRKLETSEQVLEMWEEVKKKEKQQKTASESIDQIAKTLPALIYAEKVQKKAAKSGIDIDCKCDTDDIGDRLFDLVAQARAQGVDPEKALADATNRFIARFNEAEKAQKK
ncbi:MAG: MazG family protein [Clostridia bacterium]|nr:MazG family protein [Clostridia bacterium]